MEPASAFALACGVIQVVQASFELLSIAKSLYQKGSIDSIEQLKSQIWNFERLLSTLETPLPSQLPLVDGADQQEFDELEMLVKGCNRTAQRLLKEIQKIEISKPHKLMEALAISAKTVLKSDTIQNLKGEIKGYQEILNTRILASLR